MTQKHWQDLKIVGFLLGLISIPVAFTFYFRETTSIHTPISKQSMEELAQEYRNSGMDRFRAAKTLLKKRVSFNMKRDQDSKAQLAASNIAVYLFPDLLPENHFEKEFAMEQFVPHQKVIEDNPGTPIAQEHFEELRNIVWNYENPKQSEQGLSDYASQMLKIYGAMSWK